MPPTTFQIDENTLDSALIKYLDITTKLNDYNEIENLNKHMMSANDQELIKLHTFNNQLKTKLLKAKQSYMLMDYGIHEYDMINNILGFTIVVVCLALFIVSRTSAENKKMLVWICMGIALFYLIVVLVILKQNSSRRTYAWSQWYWSPVKKNT